MDKNYIFSSEEIFEIHKAFSEWGFVRITGVFSSKEIQELVHEVEMIKLIASTLQDGLVWFSPSLAGDDEYVIQRISRINQYSQLINELGHNHGFLHEVSAKLLNVKSTLCADGHEGSDGAVLVIKDPNNASIHSSLRWHLDSSFTKHLPINPFVNLGVYLDDSSIDKGGLVVAPKSHRLGSAFDTNLAETTEYYENEICIAANKGDIVVHSSNLWHCSRQYSMPGGLRRILYFNYFPDRT